MIKQNRFIAVSIGAALCALGAGGCSKAITKLPQTAVHQTPTPAPAPIEKRVTFPPIYFDSGQTVLEPAAMSGLYAVGSYLSNNPDYRLVIEGYADERGDPFFDNYVSKERAKSAYDWIVLYGAYHISAKRVEMKSYGDSRPAQTNCGADGACHAKNRRVELYAVKG